MSYHIGVTQEGLLQACLLSVFKKTQGLPEKNSSPILIQKLKVMESTLNFVQKTQENLNFMRFNFTGRMVLGQFHQQISRFLSKNG